MTTELNTPLTARYVLVDDHVAPPRIGRGHRPDLTDGELTCLAVAWAFTRVAQRLLAMAAGIWHNWMTGVTSKRSLIAFDH